MYQVFIVEDEVLIRSSIRKVVEQMSGPYAFCGEAADGEMALSMMQDIMPDILITDIRMPFMDGFDLIRQVKAMMPWTRIIIISGFDDFEYAQKAISIGVDRYLLKPVRADDIISSIEQVTERIEAERKKNENTTGFDANEVHAALYQHFMRELLHGGMNTAAALDQARLLQLNLTYPYYQTVLFSFDAEEYDHRDLFATSKKLIKDLSIDLYYYNGSERLTLLLTGQTAEAITNETYRILKIMRHELERVCPVITTVIGNVVQRLSSIPDAYLTTRELSRKVSAFAAGRVVDANDTTQLTTDILSFSSVMDEGFRVRLANTDAEGVTALVDEYLGGEDGQQYDSVLVRYNTLMNVLKLSARLIAKGLNSTEDDVSAELSSKYDILSLCGRRETFRTAMIAMLSQAVQRPKEQQYGAKYRRVITRAIEYIRQNYCDPNISLISVAEYINMSPAHLSTVFSQTTGQTFINYLTELRVNRAKEMLRTTDMKLSAIAMEIGYNEPNYFSHVFRKSVGMTPKDYRNLPQDSL